MPETMYPVIANTIVVISSMKREPTAKERKKIGSVNRGLQSGRGGWSREVLAPWADDVVVFEMLRYSVAI
jgi:hypothetical protein